MPSCGRIITAISMARPLKTNAEHFKHTRDFRNELAVKALRQRFGIVGYGITVMLLEFLTGTEYMRIEWNEIQRELISADFGTDSETLQEVVEYGCKVGVFRMENSQETEFSNGKTAHVFSPLLQHLLRDLLEFRAGERTRKGVFRTENPQETPPNNSFPHGKSHSIVEYSKDISISDSANQTPLPETLPEKESAVAPPPEKSEDDPHRAEALALVKFCASLPTLGSLKRQLTVDEASRLVMLYGLQAAKEAAEGRDGYKGCENYTSVYVAVEKWAKTSHLYTRSNPKAAPAQAPKAANLVQAPAGWKPNPVISKPIPQKA